jgi:hypothetical protein
LLTNGEDSLVGTVAGAVLGAAAAQGQKKELRDQARAATVSAIKTSTSRLPNVVARLVDTYTSGVFGAEIEFDKRDAEIVFGQRIAEEVARACIQFFDVVVSLAESLGKVQRGELDISTRSVFDMGNLKEARRAEATRIERLVGEAENHQKHLVAIQTALELRAIGNGPANETEPA